MPTQVGIHDSVAATKKVVDADLRQHDDVANSGASVVSSVGISVSRRFFETPLDRRDALN